MSISFNKNIDKWMTNNTTNYDYKRRRCLKCNKFFRTTKSRRICGSCKDENKTKTGVSIW